MSLDMISEIEDCETQNNGTKFQFLPGHKALLLGLPKKIKEYDEWTLKKKQKRRTFQV